jgi:uncharacterized membrane protein YozB (DUF420 family)
VDTPMLNALIIFLAISLLAGLLFFEKNGKHKGKLATKTIFSCLFIFTTLVQSRPTRKNIVNVFTLL